MKKFSNGPWLSRHTLNETVSCCCCRIIGRDDGTEGGEECSRSVGDWSATTEMDSQQIDYYNLTDRQIARLRHVSCCLQNLGSYITCENKVVLKYIINPILVNDLLSFSTHTN